MYTNSFSIWKDNHPLFLLLHLPRLEKLLV